MSKNKNLVEGILGEVLNLEQLGKKAEKAADKLLKDNAGSCVGVAVIMIGKIGSSCATSSEKTKLNNKDLVRMLKDQVRSLEKSLETSDAEEDEDEKADELFDKLQTAVDELDDKEALVKVMTEAALSTVMTGATALDGLKKVNKAVGNVLTDSELEILHKSLRKKHEEDDGDED